MKINDKVEVVEESDECFGMVGVLTELPSEQFPYATVRADKHYPELDLFAQDEDGQSLRTGGGMEFCVAISHLAKLK